MSQTTRCVLVVEDQCDNQRILRDLLSHAGYCVVEASTGEEGVATAATMRPDLIVMDVRLPGIDGHEATRRIRTEPVLRHIPIIIVTSYALTDDESQARAAGASDYISKPFSPRALLEMVRRYVP